MSLNVAYRFRQSALKEQKGLEELEAAFKKAEEALRKKKIEVHSLINLMGEANQWNPFLKEIWLFCKGHPCPEADALLEALMEKEPSWDDAAAAYTETLDSEAAPIFLTLYGRLRHLEMVIDGYSPMKANRDYPPAMDTLPEKMPLIWEEVLIQRSQFPV